MEDSSSVWKIITIVLVSLLITVSFIAVFTFKGGAAAQAEPLSVSISGPSKLHVNEVGVYTASVNNSESGDLDFVWSISPIDNKTTLTPNGSVCSLSFNVATEEPYLFIVNVTDKASGATGNADMIVRDPYTQSNLYVGASAASYTSKVTADGLGWYQVLNGTTDQVIPSSGTTNPTTAINYALTLGGTTFIKGGAYTGASITVPANAVIIAEPTVTGIKYDSIGNGAKIDEPNFNGAFGGYQSGSYTIVTNKTSAATAATWYLAFAPDNSISWTSTNATTTINQVYAALTPIENTVIIKGNYTDLGQLTPPAYSHTIGYGGASLTCKQNLNTNFFLIQDASNVEIEGLKIFATATQTAGMDAVFFNNSDFSSIHDCEVAGGYRPDPVPSNTKGEAVELLNCNNCTIYNNYIHDAGYDDVKIRAESNYNKIYANTIVDSKRSACIQVAWGGYSEGYDKIPYYNEIFGNTLLRTESNPYMPYCIKLHSPYYTHIYGNTMTSLSAIWIGDDSYGNKIEANQLIQNTNGTAQPFIIIQYPSGSGNKPSYNLITNNDFRSTKTCWLQIDSGVGNVFRGNDVYGAATATLLNLAADAVNTTIIQNNFHMSLIGTDSGTGTIIDSNFGYTDPDTLIKTNWGYTTIGITGWTNDINNTIQALCTNTSGGVIQSVSAYISVSASASIRFAIYHSVGANFELLYQTPAQTVTTTAGSWVTVNFNAPKPIVQAGQNVTVAILALTTSGEVKVAYTSAVGAGSWYGTQAVTSFPSTVSAYTAATSARSIYCTTCMPTNGIEWG